MGHWEDFWWDTTKELEELGLKNEFNIQLEKMNFQDKHNYKDTRAKWSYARDKILKKNKNGSTN
mgnify:FL=1|tara:strand:+ start:1339 stop:1530 length:192 start_codon:yes stop_codon:yes gene_type:complete